MSIAFVDREPEKQEIERLRQLLGRYDQETLPSLLFHVHSPLSEIIAESFEIASDLLYDSPNENPKGNLDYKIVLNPKIHFGAVKVVWYPFTAYWEYLSHISQ